MIHMIDTSALSTIEIIAESGSVKQNAKRASRRNFPPTTFEEQVLNVIYWWASH